MFFRYWRRVLKNLTPFPKLHILTILTVCNLEVFGLLEPTVREASGPRKHVDATTTTEPRQSKADERKAIKSKKTRLFLEVEVATALRKIKVKD